MNDLKELIKGFELIKEKGWIHAKQDEDNDFYFPNCEDIHVKCTSEDYRFPIWLLSIPHGLDTKYCNAIYDYTIETDHTNNVLRLLIYLNNNVIYKKELLLLSDFEQLLNYNFRYFALIYCDNKRYFSKNYYRYNKMYIYRFKGSDTFLQLLNKHIINIKVTNTNVIFTISKLNIEQLYRVIYKIEDKTNSFLSFLDK